MKSTAYLINTSRGPVVDEVALVVALRSGTIAGAALDVYEHEPRIAEGLADCPNALLLPHLGECDGGDPGGDVEDRGRERRRGAGGPAASEPRRGLGLGRRGLSGIPRDVGPAGRPQP